VFSSVPLAAGLSGARKGGREGGGREGDREEEIEGGRGRREMEGWRGRDGEGVREREGGMEGGWEGGREGGRGVLASDNRIARARRCGGCQCDGGAGGLRTRMSRSSNKY
jgi:hypothetical protein